MADIFLSYASEDRSRAKVIAEGLESEGWDVWWDREIRAGERFDQVIDQAIGEARCIIVLWSRISVAKNWVLEEAADGRDRGILVPVQIDEVKLPRGFRRIQAASLVGWDGNTDSPLFRRLVADIAAVMHREPTVPVAEHQAERMAAWQLSQPNARPDRPAQSIAAGKHRGLWALGGLCAITAIAAAWWFATQPPAPQLPGTVEATKALAPNREPQPPYEMQVISTASSGVALMRKPRGDSEVVARLLEKSRLTVTGPAVEAQGQRWRPVRLDKGWIAEGEIDPARPRLLEPLDSQQITVGGLARVRYPRADGLNLRQGPNLASPIIAALYKGSVVEVIGTPEHLQGYRWWLVRLPEAWIPEGLPGAAKTIVPIR